MTAPLYAIDTSYLVHRAYHAAKRDAEHSAHAYIRATLRGLMRNMAPTRMVTAWDRDEPSWRKQRWPAYKSCRPDKPQELRDLFPWTRILIESLGIPCLDAPGYEADDVISSVVSACTLAGEDVVIVTGDRDLAQLIDSHVSILRPGGEVVDLDAWTQAHPGLIPPQWPHVRALAGDRSDGIPGVPKVGDGKAEELIRHFGSVGALYERIAEAIMLPGIGTAIHDSLIAHREDALLYLELCKLRDPPGIAWDEDSIDPTTAAAAVMQQSPASTSDGQSGHGRPPTPGSAPLATDGEAPSHSPTTDTLATDRPAQATGATGSASDVTADESGTGTPPVASPYPPAPDSPGSRAGDAPTSLPDGLGARTAGADSGPRSRAPAVHTRSWGLTDEQLADRRNHLGASEVAAVCGLNPYSTPADVYAAKIEGEARLTKPAVEWGSRLESAVLERYHEDHPGELLQPGTLIHPEQAWASATPDAIVSARLVEIKTTGQAWESLPVYYAAQVHWQHWIVRAALSIELDEVSHVPCLAAGRDYRVWDVPLDYDLLASLIEGARRFWDENVSQRVAPTSYDERTLSRVAKALGRLRASERVSEATDSDAALLANLRTWRARHEVAKSAVEKLEDRLRCRIGDGAALVADGAEVASWRNTRDRTRVDWEAVAREAGASQALIQQHTTTTAGYRRLNVR